MFRPISEIAVAINVASVCENPRSSASARPLARAMTRSSSVARGNPTSSAIADTYRGHAVEQRDRLVEVEGGGQRLQVEVEVDHRNGNVGTNADDDRRSAPELRRYGDRPKRPRQERVDHVERRHVDHDSPRSDAPD